MLTLGFGTGSVTGLSALFLGAHADDIEIGCGGTILRLARESVVTSARCKLGSEPDLVFTPRLDDAHQDHRMVSELTWNTFRDQLILEYEIPKYEGDIGSPNLYVRLPEWTARRKAELIEATYRTQADRNWFSQETFLSLMRLRAIESRAPSGFAEAFVCRKVVL